jgi:hypothetical protein
VETFLNIILVIIQFSTPIVIFTYIFFMRRRMKKFNEETRQVYEELLENRREEMLSHFLERNPEIDPEIFVEKKEPIVPKRDKPRHHFNHEGDEYFM